MSRVRTVLLKLMVFPIYKNNNLKREELLCAVRTQIRWEIRAGPSGCLGDSQGFNSQVPYKVPRLRPGLNPSQVKKQKKKIFAYLLQDLYFENRITILFFILTTLIYIFWILK
jgi:hypothetical protein